MTIFGLVVAVLLLTLFAADLLMNVPFKTESKTMNIGVMIASVILGYISFSTFREQK